MTGFFNLQLFAKEINLTKKDDTYSNTTSNRIIYALAGNDSIQNSADKVTVSGGKGKDTLRTDGVSYVSLSGDAGDDYIASYNPSSNVTLSGGAGNDSICSNYGDNVIINGDTGNDSIDNYFGGDYATISGGAGNDYIDNSGDNATISGGTGKDSIYNEYDSNVTINGDAGNDYIYNDGSDAYGSNVTLSGGAGNDSIYNSSLNVTVNGGTGNDYIYNDGSDDYIYDDDSDDYAYNPGSNVTISGGAGNDSISLSAYAVNNLIIYSSGDGNDVISGFGSDDTLHITKGSYSVKTNKNDVIVTVGDDDITLKDAAGQELTIKNSKGKVTKKTYGKATSSNISELWFDSENNFVTADNLSSIVENNSVGEFEFNSPEKLTQENLITYTAK